MLIFANGFVQVIKVVIGLFHFHGRLFMGHPQICLSFRVDDPMTYMDKVWKDGKLVHLHSLPSLYFKC